MMAPQEPHNDGEGAVNALTAEKEVLDLFYALAALEPVSKCVWNLLLQLPCAP